MALGNCWTGLWNFQTCEFRASSSGFVTLLAVPSGSLRCCRCWGFTVAASPDPLNRLRARCSEATALASSEVHEQTKSSDQLKAAKRFQMCFGSRTLRLQAAPDGERIGFSSPGSRECAHCTPKKQSCWQDVLRPRRMHRPPLNDAMTWLPYVSHGRMHRRRFALSDSVLRFSVPHACEHLGNALKPAQVASGRGRGRLAGTVQSPHIAEFISQSSRAVLPADLQAKTEAASRSAAKRGTSRKQPRLPCGAVLTQESKRMLRPCCSSFPT